MGKCVCVVCVFGLWCLYILYVVAILHVCLSVYVCQPVFPEGCLVGLSVYLFVFLCACHSPADRLLRTSLLPRLSLSLFTEREREGERERKKSETLKFCQSSCV